MTVKTGREAILAATLQVAKRFDSGKRFRASKVRDQLGLTADFGYSERVRECWRGNGEWLRNHGLLLESEPKQKVTWWYIRKK